MRRQSISSLKNLTLKSTLKLRDRKTRLDRRECLVEGLREIDQAISAGFKLVSVWYCEEMVSQSKQAGELLDRMKGMHANDSFVLYEVSRPVYERLVLRESSGGLAVVIQTRMANLEVLFRDAQPFIIALERVEKPGNLGAVLRTADCVGASGLLLIGDSIDLFNPNVIRASLGSCFRVPVVSIAVDDLLEHEFLLQQNWTLLTPEGASSLYESNVAGSSILLFGSEAFGIDPRLNHLGRQRIAIPMHGVTNSLNLSVSVGVVAYEAYRQRRLLS